MFWGHNLVHQSTTFLNVLGGRAALQGRALAFTLASTIRSGHFLRTQFLERALVMVSGKQDKDGPRDSPWPVSFLHQLSLGPL